MREASAPCGPLCPFLGTELGGDTACTRKVLHRSPDARPSGDDAGGSPEPRSPERDGGGDGLRAAGPSMVSPSGWVVRRITTDGRFEFNFEDSTASEWSSPGQGPDLADNGGPTVLAEEGGSPPRTPSLQPPKPLRRSLASTSLSWKPPRMSIVIMIVGTRGDVQPFLALGSALKAYGHRVRLATHETYRQWVLSYGLEFFPLGGDPKVLSEYIVRNRGILPSGLTDVAAQRQQLTDIIESTYPACTMPDAKGNNQPFTAEAIIANPPSYGHIHCAEKLGIPLQMFFTMPWSPTKAFPHPLASIANDHEWQSAGYRNKLSYFAVEDLVWAGNVDIINRFRERRLGLEPIRLGQQGAHMLHSLRVPFTYCWSPSLVPKPADWKSHIDVVGFFFLNESDHTHYSPPPDLAAFLAAGPPPVYIGFGSLIVDKPAEVTRVIFKAAVRAGVRVILSKGWGGLGVGVEIPDNVFLLDSCPHDWLFPRCSAVVHHGGAGTTAAGLLAGCPTAVIPFFGDQWFWGDACHRAGVAPPPIPIDHLSTKRLVAALKFMQQPEVKEAAVRLAARMAAEDGVAQGVKSFHKQMSRFRNNLESFEPVDWRIPKSHVVGGVYGGAGAMLYEASGAVAGVVRRTYKTAVRGGLRSTLSSAHVNDLASDFIARIHLGAVMFQSSCHEWWQKKRAHLRAPQRARLRRKGLRYQKERLDKREGDATEEPEFAGQHL